MNTHEHQERPVAHAHAHTEEELVASSALHAHKKGDAKHTHSKEINNQHLLAIALALTLGFSLVEAIAAYWAGSLALLSDAGHMVTDAAALGLALLAQIISRRPPSPRHSFGYGRAEALAAFINGIAMLALVVWIVIEAISRLFTPHQVDGIVVSVVAAIGLVMNIVVAWVLSRDRKSVNTRAALVHVMGDLLGSVAALLSGVIIQFTGWMQADSWLSILVSLLILKSTYGILRESYHFLMEGVPLHIDYLEVGRDLRAIPGVLSVHDLHVWEMAPSFPALIGHIEVERIADWPAVMARINTMLLNKHGIDHVTLQPEEMHETEAEKSTNLDLQSTQSTKTKAAIEIQGGDTFYVECAHSGGLHRMAYHAWGNPLNPKVLICVHGLTRRGSDFKQLALAMSSEYYVVCPDVVGRGESDWLSNPMLYGIPQYVSDMVTLVAHLGVAKVDWFGTSMGGMIGMVYAGMADSPIRKLLLNDVGPRIEPAALKRLGSYVGKPLRFTNRADALAQLNLLCTPFGEHSDAEWDEYNGPHLVEHEGGWNVHYDPAIAVPFAAVNAITAAAGEMALWHSFEQIQVPILIVRGAESDLLSQATVTEMCRRNAHARSIEIPLVGHAPAFIKPAQISLAKAFFN